jgi:iron complex transport system substrate-binding protein
VHAGSSLYSLDEALLARLEPDLIVTQELCAVCAVSYEVVETAIKRLDAGGRVVSLEPASLRDVLATMRYLGELTGRLDAARHFIADLEARIATLRVSTRGSQRRPRTLLLEWTDPPMSAGHWIPELVELAGGEPILANPGSNSVRLDWSAVAHADPDAIVVAPCGFDLTKTRRAVGALEENAFWREQRFWRGGILAARSTLDDRPSLGGGKSGLHRAGVQDNVLSRRLEGKCHRNIPPQGVRVKS